MLFQFLEIYENGIAVANKDVRGMHVAVRRRNERRGIAVVLKYFFECCNFSISSKTTNDFCSIFR